VFQEPSGAPGLQVYLPRSAIDVSPTSQVPLPVPGTSRLEAEDTWAWYDAPVPPPGGFLVNVGLAMELWSSGAYKATLHRVIFPDEGALGDRDTLAFFVQPDDDVVGGCCPFVHFHSAPDRQRRRWPCVGGGDASRASLSCRSLMLCTGSAPGASRRYRRYLAEGHHVGRAVRLEAPGEHEQVQEGDDGYAEHPRVTRL
jgi:hypothetical protein